MTNTNTNNAAAQPAPSADAMTIMDMIQNLPEEQRKRMLEVTPHDIGVMVDTMNILKEKGYTPATLGRYIVSEIPDAEVMERRRNRGPVGIVLSTNMTVGHVLIAIGTVVGLALLKVAFTAILKATGVNMPFFNPADTSAGTSADGPVTFASGAGIADPLAGGFAGAPAIHA